MECDTSPRMPATLAHAYGGGSGAVLSRHTLRSEDGQADRAESSDNSPTPESCPSKSTNRPRVAPYPKIRTPAIIDPSAFLAVGFLRIVHFLSHLSASEQVSRKPRSLHLAAWLWLRLGSSLVRFTVAVMLGLFPMVPVEPQVAGQATIGSAQACA